jgi:hypothetical protein
MTQRNVVQPGTRREEKTGKKLKRKDYVKTEETGDFSSIDPYI